MNQHRQHLFCAFFTAAALFGACRAFYHGVHNFQMRWVEGKGNVNRAVGRGNVGAETVVVFHVAAGEFDVLLAFKFGKQIGRFFAQGINQHV